MTKKDDKSNGYISIMDPTTLENYNGDDSTKCFTTTSISEKNYLGAVSNKALETPKYNKILSYQCEKIAPIQHFIISAR